MTERTLVDKATVVMFVYALILSVYAFFRRSDYEFVYAFVSIMVFILLLQWYDRHHHATKKLILLVAVLAFVHGAGVTINLHQTRLIDVTIFGLIKVDNLVSLFSGGVLALAIHPILKRKWSDNKNILWRFATQILIIMGFVGLWEVLGLFGVVFLGQGEKVGDYLNNAFDLFWTFIGATIVSGFVIKDETRNSP